MFEAILAVAMTLSAHAHGNVLTNGSFEAAGPDYSVGTIDQRYCYLGSNPGIECGAPPGWGWYGTSVAIRSNSTAWGAPDALAGWDTSFGSALVGVQTSSSLSQHLSLTAGVYALSWFDAGRNTSFLGGIHAHYYEVRLGSNLLDSFTTSSGLGWAQHTLTFSAGPGGYTLTFQGLDPGNEHSTSFVDMVTLTAVPEPTSWLMMIVGTLALLAWRRRTRA